MVLRKLKNFFFHEFPLQLLYSAFWGNHAGRPTNGSYEYLEKKLIFPYLKHILFI